MKTIKFYTLGCKANQYDTQSIREHYMRCGFRELDNGEPADVYVINTCTVTHKADSDSLGFIRRAKKENPKARVIVTGCLAELDGKRIKRETGVGLIVKNKEKMGIVNKEGISDFYGHTRAFLKIQDGCNNFCSYCKVPLVRGVSRSKPLNEVAKEAQRLVANGFKEIVLTGICLGAYGRDLKDKKELISVIEALEKIEGLLRIRLSSVEAGDVSDVLIDKMAYSKKLCPHLHIPIQSGDDEILKKMNRRYTRVDYLNLIEKIRNKIPEIAITTDCLVGFPGETDENLKNSVELIRKITPLKVHIFPYSKREGTQAASLEQTLKPQIIKERVEYLKKAADKCALEYRKMFLNKVMDVLIEGKSKDATGFWEGYTGNYIKVILKSELNLRNSYIPVKLKKLEVNFFLAKPL